MAAEALSRALSSRTGQRLLELAAPLVDEADPEARDWGGYQIVRELGRGGSGVVYEVIDQTFGQTWALKVLKEGPAADGDTWLRFQREALAATRLFHPNIVPVGELHETYLVMRYVEGETLGALSEGEPRRLVRLVRDAARAVHYAHGQGVVHRDLKPQNLMVSRAGDHVYVMDFGLAKLRGRAQLEGDRGRILGTPAYMAPEQVLAREEEVDARTDVYALGATLYHLLSGAPPFQGEGVQEVLRRVRDEAPAPLGAEVDPVLGGIVLRCLEKDASRRYPSAEALAAALSAWLQE